MPPTLFPERTIVIMEKVFARSRFSESKTRFD